MPSQPHPAPRPRHYRPPQPGWQAGVRGLRISVEQLLKALAAGQAEAELLAEYPELELVDFRVVLGQHAS